MSEQDFWTPERIAWGNQFWTVEPLLAGATIFCVAPGPSFTAEVAARLAVLRQAQDEVRCIFVNGACHNAAAAGLDGEILYFTDSGWWKKHVDEVDAWRGMIVTASRRAKAERPDRLRRVELFECSAFGVPGKLRNGRSSGHIAVSLAGALGGVRVPLVGYDMRVVDGREHCHDDYAALPGKRDLGIYEREFLPGFVGWDAQARAAGFEVVNATPGSALTEFRMGALEEVLRGAWPRARPLTPPSPPRGEGESEAA